MHMDETQAAVPAPRHTVLEWLGQLQQKLTPDSTGTQLDVRLHDRAIQTYLSPAAMTAATALTAPLTVEMELYFSCFVRKAVRFHERLPLSDSPADSHTRLHEHLHLQFCPVTTQHCSMASCDEAPPMESMPVTRPQAFLPRWVTIDYRHGQWLGEFGY